MKEQVLDRSDASNAARTSRDGMNHKFWRRGAMLSVAASLSAAGLILGMGAAQAAAIVTVQSPTPVYTSTSVSSGQVGIPELQPGDSVVVVCWTRGQSLHSGNVWYRTADERYAKTGLELPVAGWVHGGTADSNEAFHEGAIPAC
jgi:hypothetical protein